MSVYTVEVKYICEVESGLVQTSGYNDIDEVIDNSWEKIFKKFPIFDESYREGLCKKILNHYYTREICAETVALWKFWLNQKMNEIMPYYNKLYMSEQLKYDPLHEIDFTREIHENTSNNGEGNRSSNGKASNTNNISSSTDDYFKAENTDIKTPDITRTITGETENRQTNTGNTTTNSSTNGQELFSDTPQGSISNLADGNYLTSAKMNTSTTDTTNTIDTQNKNDGRSVSQDVTSGTEKTSCTKLESNSINNKSSKIGEELTSDNENYSKTDAGIREYLEHIHGKNSGTSYSKLIQDYRDSLLNIDMDIIFELRDLFMNIY